MNAIVLLLLSVQGPTLPIACINASYSRDDEVEITNDLGHLIIGAFAHHGPAFYENEIDRCAKLLEQDPEDFEARNDLGAAYTKLGRWEEAQAAFDENERLHPGKYETASNLGVMFKKMGRYAEAAAAIRRALEIKPGGHMGLGDYYLQMIEWRDEIEQSTETVVAADDAPEEDAPEGADTPNDADAPEADDTPATVIRSDAEPTENFLGVPYDAGTSATAAVANKEYIITLIKNDVAFSDAYLVLGDILFEEQDYQMALRAYHRAAYLDDEQEFHMHASQAYKRAAAVVRLWRDTAKPGYVVEQGMGHYPQLEQEIVAAAEWLKKYQAIEAELIQEGQDVSFAAMKPEVERRGLTPPRLIEAVHYAGTTTTYAPDFTLAVMTMGLLAIVVVVLAIGGAIAIVLILRKQQSPPGKGVANG